MKLRYIHCAVNVGEDGVITGYRMAPENCNRTIDASEADSLLSSLGLTFIKATTLETFLQRSSGNRLSVIADGVEHAFAKA